MCSMSKKARAEISNLNRIKQFRIVEYCGYYLGANLSGELVAMKSLKKINTKLQFLYRQNEFINPKLRSLLNNFLIQPHFDCACISWYPLVSQKIRKKRLLKINEVIVSVFTYKTRSYMALEIP